MSASAVSELTVPAKPYPYASSWVDRVGDWVRALHLPSGLFYLAIGLLFVLAEFTAKWIDGTYPFPEFNLFHIPFVAIGTYALWAIHHLDDYAATAIEQFRPALSATNAEYEQLRYRLTTLPLRTTAICTALSMLAVIMILFFSSKETAGIYLSLKLYTSPWSYAVEGAALIVWGAATGPFIYHAYHQLTVVHQIYTRHTTVNLFNLRPLYAFARLSGRAALIFVLMIYPAFLTTPRVWNDPVTLVSSIGISLIAFWNFLGPLLGIHRILAVEKDLRQHEISARIEQVCNQMDEAVDSGREANMEAMNASLEALVTRQDRLERTPTWPWHADTPRLIATAILLPIVLYLIQVFIERLLLP